MTIYRIPFFITLLISSVLLNAQNDTSDFGVGSIIIGIGFPNTIAGDDPNVNKSIEDSYTGNDGFGLNKSFSLFLLQRYKSGVSGNFVGGFSLLTYDWDNIYDPAYTDYGKFSTIHMGGGISFVKNTHNSNNFGYSTDFSLLLNMNMGDGGYISFDDNINHLTISTTEKFLSIGFLASASLFIGKFTLTLSNIYHVSKSSDTTVTIRDSNFNLIDEYSFQSNIDLSNFIISIGLSL